MHDFPYPYFFRQKLPPPEIPAREEKEKKMIGTILLYRCQRCKPWQRTVAGFYRRRYRTSIQPHPDTVRQERSTFLLALGAGLAVALVAIVALSAAFRALGVL